jgi:hypothetical protein
MQTCGGGPALETRKGLLPLQAAVRAVRNARAEYGVEPGRKIAAIFAVASPELRAALQAELGVLALLARLEGEQVGALAARTVRCAMHCRASQQAC